MELSTTGAPRRLWGDAYALSDLLELVGGGIIFAARDFALLTLAAQLSIQFPGQLADLAELLVRDDVSDDDVSRLARSKFELVKKGAANRAGRIEQHLTEMGADYDAVVPGLFPQARTYREAMEVVWPRIKPLIP
jgi:hypothetical protein